MFVRSSLPRRTFFDRIDGFLSATLFRPYPLRRLTIAQKLIFTLLVAAALITISTNMALLTFLSEDGSMIGTDSGVRGTKHTPIGGSHPEKIPPEYRISGNKPTSVTQTIATNPPTQAPTSSPTSPPTQSSSTRARVALWRDAHAVSDPQCAAQFGNGYQDIINLCKPNQSSSLTCYYNSVIGGTVCEGYHVRIDRDSINVAKGGEPIENVLGRAEGAEFPTYVKGAFSVTCDIETPLSAIANAPARLPHHLYQMMESTEYHGNIIRGDHECDVRIMKRTALIVTRYEYANIYHSMSDFYNVYQAQQMFDASGIGNVDVIFFDGHSQGKLDDIWLKLFGPHVYYIKQMPHRLMCYDHAVWVSPGYKCALGVDVMHGDTNRCRDHPALRDFISHLIATHDDTLPSPEKFALDYVRPPPTRPDSRLTVTIIFRRDYMAHPRVGARPHATRKIANEDEVMKAAQSIPDVVVTGMDFAKLTPAEQIKAIRDSDVVVGVHGAALSYALCMEPGSALLELVPPDYASRPHFKYFAAWANRDYSSISIPSGQPDHTVPIPAFTEALRASVETVRRNNPKRIILNSSAKSDINKKEESNEDDILKNFIVEEKNPPVDGHKLCLVVPFRDSADKTSQGSNRTANLNEFIPYMINHLSQVGRIPERDYEIIIAEQTQGYIFNKGAMFNVGYHIAKKMGCDYMVLHDVDQVPLSLKNRYDYDDKPTHMCTATSQFNYQLAYGSMVGGAMKVTIPFYEKMNGFSNFYWGWGQEDDDFYYRVVRTGGANVLKRLSAEEGRYRALSHPRVKDLDVTEVFKGGADHMHATMNGSFDIQTDGISNLKYKMVKMERIQRGYIRALADLTFDEMPRDLSKSEKQK